MCSLCFDNFLSSVGVILLDFPFERGRGESAEEFVNKGIEFIDLLVLSETVVHRRSSAFSLVFRIERSCSRSVVAERYLAAASCAVRNGFSNVGVDGGMLGVAVFCCFVSGLAAVSWLRTSETSSPSSSSSSTLSVWSDFRDHFGGRRSSGGGSALVSWKYQHKPRSFTARAHQTSLPWHVALNRRQGPPSV